MDIFMYKATKEEISLALAWWRNLSNNQMKSLKNKYFPNYSFNHNGMIFEMWNSEKRPEPQQLIPVLAEFR